MKRYINRQLYGECQLVSAINACIYLGMPIPEYGKAFYRLLVYVTKSEHGAAIYIDKAYRSLGIKFKKMRGKISIEKVSKNLPVQVSLFPPHKSFHSCLIVRAEKDRVWLTNYYKNRLAVLPWDQMEKMLPVRIASRESIGYFIKNKMIRKDTNCSIM